MSDATKHYKSNKEVYHNIERELQRVNDHFCNSDRFTQKILLFDSSVYAVMSVQNSVNILKRAFNSYAQSDNWDEVQEAFKMLNYGNNKFDYTRNNFDTIFSSVGDEICDALEMGNVWDAVNLLVENVEGVSWIKAPFICCMLGFTNILCIDTNVAQMAEDDSVKARGYTSQESYQLAIESIKAEYSDLSDLLSTFMLQWVLFDANRENGVTRHEEWFNHILPGTPFSRQAGLDEY